MYVLQALSACGHLGRCAVSRVAMARARALHAASHWTPRRKCAVSVRAAPTTTAGRHGRSGQIAAARVDMAPGNKAVSV